MNTAFNVRLAMFAGEILLRNGSETFRVEDTITRILKHYEFIVIDTISTTTGIYVSAIDKDGNAVTLVRRIHDRTINLNNIVEVNTISRDICEGRICAQKAFDELVKIYNTVTYPDHVLIFSWAFACSGFAYILKNSLAEAFATLFISFIVGFIAIKYCKKLSRIAYPFVVSALTATASIIVASFFDGLIMDNLIISGIMPLVPGVACVNTVRDLLNGDYMSAQSRLLDLIVVAICIALGVGLALSVNVKIGDLLWFF